MIKPTLCIIIIFTIIFSQAQQPANLDFEEWSSIGNDMENPDGWETSNVFLNLTPLPYTYKYNTATKDTIDPYSGNACVKLTTESNNIIIIGEMRMPGMLTLGRMNIDMVTQSATVDGGIHFPYRPTKMKGYYKYQKVDNDSCLLGMVLYKYGAAGQPPDTIGRGFLISDNIMDWQAFEIPIEYSTDEIPDTLNIIALSSYDHLQLNVFTGSTLWVDSLYFEYDSTSFIGDYAVYESPTSIYPNPAQQQIRVDYQLPNGIKQAEMAILDLSGNIICIKQLPTVKNTLNISLTGLSPGTYICVVQSDKGIHSRKKLILL